MCRDNTERPLDVNRQLCLGSTCDLLSDQEKAHASNSSSHRGVVRSSEKIIRGDSSPNKWSSRNSSSWSRGKLRYLVMRT